MLLGHRLVGLGGVEQKEDHNSIMQDLILLLLASRTIYLPPAGMNSFRRGFQFNQI